MLVSVVIPCYNSEHTIEKVVDLCVEEFEKLDGYELEMILVNDYSKDKTFEAIRRAVAKYPDIVTGINLAKNFGQHSALMTAFQYVNGDLVVGMDDDMQNHPSQIALFLSKMEEGYDVVFGIYKKRKFSAWKNFYTRINHFLLWHLLDRPAGIEMSNFWLARRFVVECAKEYRGISAYVQLIFFRTTHNIANIEINHFEREAGHSNYTFRKGLKLFLSFMNYSVIPLRMTAILGALCSGAGIISTIIVIINKLIHPDVRTGWSSLMCVFLLFFGVLVLLLGVVGEYIGKIILTQSNTPLYVVRETVNVSGEGAKEVKELPHVSDKNIREAD